MQCPVCHVELNMMDRQGIEIDYCPKCRGVWLDRGELDKLVERASAGVATAPAHPGHDQDVRRPDPQYQDSRSYRDDDHHDSRRDHDRSHSSDPRKHKKESFLGDLFDFGD